MKTLTDAESYVEGIIDVVEFLLEKGHIKAAKDVNDIMLKHLVAIPTPPSTITDSAV